jgi:hypothetical protein
MDAMILMSALSAVFEDVGVTSALDSKMIQGSCTILSTIRYRRLYRCSCVMSYSSGTLKVLSLSR